MDGLDTIFLKREIRDIESILEDIEAETHNDFILSCTAGINTHLEKITDYIKEEISSVNRT